MKLSIIVPVYNIEKDLPRCIESILSQEFRDYELLLIDDGSTDGSPALCDMFAGQDSRIHVTHKANGGASTARNAGLDQAIGEFIVFVDGDDELLPGALSAMTRAADASDSAICSHQNIWINLDGIKRESNYRPEKISSDQAVRRLLRYEMNCAPWGKTYRRSVIQYVRFDPIARMGQDLVFLMACHLETGCTVEVFPDYVYAFRARKESTTHNGVAKLEKYEKLSFAAKNLLMKHGVFEKYEADYAMLFCIGTMQAMRWSLSIPCSKTLNQYIEYAKLLNFTFVPADRKVARRLARNRAWGILCLACKFYPKRALRWLYHRICGLSHGFMTSEMNSVGKRRR